LFKIFQALEEGVEVGEEEEVEVEAILIPAFPTDTATLGRWEEPGKGCAWKLLMKRKIICTEN
jgi:hypothetical protein